MFKENPHLWFNSLLKINLAFFVYEMILNHDTVVSAKSGQVSIMLPRTFILKDLIIGDVPIGILIQTFDLKSESKADISTLEIKQKCIFSK